MTRREHLRHRRHPDEVGPERAHHPDLGRRLERRSQPGRVHALAELEPDPCRSVAGGCPVRRVVGVGQVREAGPERVVVRADERRRPLEVQVVGDGDEPAGLE